MSSPARTAPDAAWSRTPALERWGHHAALALVALSGVALFVMKDVLRPPEDGFAVVSHPLQPFTLHVHVVTAPLLVLAIGMLVRHHALARWRTPSWSRARRSGAALTLLALPMLSTGYLLQVATDDGWRAAWKWSHLATAGLYVLAAALHVVGARRRAAGEAGMSLEEPTGEPAEASARRVRRPVAARA